VAARAVAGLIAGTLALNLDQVCQPAGPADPEIDPGHTETGASFRPPFIVRNPNAIFDMANLQFECGVDLIYFQDADYKNALVRDVAFLTGNASIRPNGQMLYDCDVSHLLRSQPDGLLTFRDPMATSHIEFREPLRILKMCLWIGGTYNVWGHNLSFIS